MHSAEGYLKALPTRAAQLATASIFYGTDGFVYSPPSASHSIDGDEMASVFSTAAVPAPSPAACSLRGKVKSAFKKATEKAKLSLGLISSRAVCALLATSSCVCGLLQSSVHVALTFHLSFCRSNVVNHFFCDIPPLLALSCSDIYTNEIVLFALAACNTFFALLVILASYLFIFIAILRMHSSQGRQKAFSTCASHLTTVSIFYGTVIFMYLQPSSSHSLGTDKVVSVFHAVVIPRLNPLVYSLRNKEVKSAFKRVVGKAGFARLSLLIRNHVQTM
ncbi:hypothetical protein AB1E18_010885 [Capra hircus]